MPRLFGIAGQTKYVCLCFSKTLSSQGHGTSHLKESVNLSLRARERITSHFRIPSSSQIEPIFTHTILNVGFATPAVVLPQIDSIWHKSGREFLEGIISRAPRKESLFRGTPTIWKQAFFSYVRLVLFLSPHASRLTLHEFPLYLLQPRPGYLHCCPACKVRIRRTSSIVCGFP